jgi:hypothetical protein
MPYTLSSAEYKKLKTKLTRAVNSKNNDNIIKTCDEAKAIFDQKGYPDSWSNWERAQVDAQFALGLPQTYWD